MNDKKMKNSNIKHPHIENPTQEQLLDLLKDREPNLTRIFQKIHSLILEILPDIVHSIDCRDGMMGYGARQYGYDGWGMAALAAHKNWVSLMFMRGVELEDSKGLLEGTGKKMRHIKFKTRKEFEEKRNALEELIKEASNLNYRGKNSEKNSPNSLP